MDAATFQPQRFQAEIGSLIDEVEACLNAAGDDREARLQREAFRERCERARSLARRLADAADSEQRLLDGDAHRLREALALSRDFFRRRAQR